MKHRITLFETPPNNHGRRGFELVIVPITETEGFVLDGFSCNSCWQVGHDNGEPCIPIGTKVKLPNSFNFNRIVWSKNGRRTRVRVMNWANASRLAGRSHNELVDDWDDPRPDCTLVRPSELIRTEEVSHESN